MWLPPRGQNDRQLCSRACEIAVRVAARRGFTSPEPVDGAVWIELGNGAFTLVSVEDAPVLVMHTWWKHATGYATTKINGRQVKLHRLLFPDFAAVDHANRDRLDNRRANLREATRSQNGANCSISSINTSGFKGVSRYGSKWGAKITVRGARLWLGLYDTPEAAAAAYDRAAVAAHGQFAAPNTSLLKGFG